MRMNDESNSFIYPVRHHMTDRHQRIEVLDPSGDHWIGYYIPDKNIIELIDESNTPCQKCKRIAFLRQMKIKECRELPVPTCIFYFNVMYTVHDFVADTGIKLKMTRIL